MSNTIYDINVMRNIILESQHLLKKSSDSIEDITSDLCGLQYDPYPAIHLNQYIMLWNRKKDFKAEQLDIAAYKDFKVVETWTFKRNMFLVPRDEYSLYKNATKGILRWGSSDESWLAAGDSPEIQAAEKKLKESLIEFDGLTANQIWENLNYPMNYIPVWLRKEIDMSYIVNTGQFEKGTQEQQAAFIRLFGSENIQYKFDFYFHWFNIVHEYGHCLCSYHESNIIGLKQEFLVNRFAVSIWQYAGYDKELKSLHKMLSEILQRMKNPVPDNMSFTDYYEQIWGTDEIMEVPIYGYFQFKSVKTALESREDLATVLGEMGIHKEIKNKLPSHKKYSISAQTAKEVLHDIQNLLDNLGIEQPIVDVELVDDPSIHCVNYIDFLD